MSHLELDLSLPLANLLRTGTATAHADAEKGARWLARGELDKDEYIRFLMMLWHVYE
jgi:heme oxygenase (biliverdin-producing, ferredoxin)